MGEIDDAGYAENHRQAEGHQAVNEARQYSRNDDVAKVNEIEGHVFNTFALLYYSRAKTPRTQSSELFFP
jgi:hypothetical protein